ncbi:MAG TPA: mismatch-specific DNA-glycosylase [Gemmatimonadales bacterium]|nr:mismatch-specific DNA-glycosylase [Gemmatimonadales bacterium]
MPRRGVTFGRLEPAGVLLPDLLKEGLRLVICSFTAGEKVAEAGQWYAAPGNRLWETLHRVGLTPRQLEPAEWRSLLDYGIGLVDLTKDHSGQDRGVKFEGGRELRRKIRQYQPEMLVFNGKRAAKEYLVMPTVVFGLLPHTIGTTKLFVCPSTSAAAKSSWDPRWWDLMAKLA